MKLCPTLWRCQSNVSPRKSLFKRSDNQFKVLQVVRVEIDWVEAMQVECGV